MVSNEEWGRGTTSEELETFVFPTQLLDIFQHCKIVS